MTDTNWHDQLPLEPDNLVVWFLQSIDYWHCWYNMRDGASAPRTTDDVRVRFWHEYWQQADTNGYHPAVASPAPEDYDLRECEDC